MVQRLSSSLVDQWDTILKEEGFNDIEGGIGKNPHMLRGTPSIVPFCEESHSEPPRTDKEEYYSQRDEFLRLGQFASDRDKEIWTLHTNGYTVREIARLIGGSKTTVHRKITEYTKIMHNGTGRLNEKTKNICLIKQSKCIH